MKIAEYKNWLKENANIEEKYALEVVDAILNLHCKKSFENEDIFPRKKYKGIEYDLLIMLTDNKERIHKVIGVEFKSTNIEKVIGQAIKRCKNVDYMYIATEPLIDIGYVNVFLLCYYGIGWIVWLDKVAYPILKARRNGGYITPLIEFLKKEGFSEVRLDKFFRGEQK